MKHEPYPIIGHIVLIPTEQIHLPDDSFGIISEQAITALADQIHTYGLLQPLLVSMISQDQFSLISSELIFKAAVACGMTALPCVLVNAGEQDCILLRLIADSQQVSPHYLKRARWISKITEEHGYTIPQTAEILGCPLKEAADQLKLSKLPDEVQATIVRENIDKEIASVLAHTPQEEQSALLEQIVLQRLTMDQLEDQIRIKKGSQAMKGKIVVFKDTAVFTNTIDRAVTAMSEAGIHSLCRKTESDRQIEYHITINKKPSVDAAHISTG